MNGRGWIGRLALPRDAERERRRVRVEAAARLGVPVDEVGLVEHEDVQGWHLFPSWVPS